MTDEPTDSPETPVTDAVDQLAQAQTPAELAAAHRAVTTAVRATRKAKTRAFGRLASAYGEALEILDAQRAAGVPFEERIQGLEEILRGVWPQTRPWHYLCPACSDTGLVLSVCRAGARCPGISTRDGKAYRRLCATEPESAYEHAYGWPCACATGARFREKAKPTPEDFTAAGKMTRVGRRR